MLTLDKSSPGLLSDHLTCFSISLSKLKTFSICPSSSTVKPYCAYLTLFNGDNLTRVKYLYPL